MKSAGKRLSFLNLSTPSVSISFGFSPLRLSVCRVCELEGKVRELESSMARMGAQHDVNMELIGTFRHQKETVRNRQRPRLLRRCVVYFALGLLLDHVLAPPPIFFFFCV